MPSIFNSEFAPKEKALPIYEKTPKELSALTELFKTSHLTHMIKSAQVDELVKSMSKMKFRAGEEIIKYGDIGQEYYVLAKGNCDVIVYSAGTDPKDPDKNMRIDYVK